MEEAIRDGNAAAVVLAHQRTGDDLVSVPSLLAVGAVHQHLVRAQMRARVTMAAEYGDVCTAPDAPCPLPGNVLPTRSDTG